MKYELKDLATGKVAESNALSGSLGPDSLDISQLIRDFGVFTYDPGFMATASTESKITYIDGDAGVLLYRGYPLEQLAAQSSFLEVANLLIYGRLPTNAQLRAFQTSITRHTMINEHLLRFFQGFHHNAHPMAMVSAVVASMAAFYRDTMDINEPRHREIFAHRIIAKLPTIAAAAYKHTLGQPFIYPRNDLSYCANMLNMFFAVPCEAYATDPVAAQAIELLFILHADHEQNASTSTVRLAGSTGANPYAAISAGVSALWGPAHGGANEAVPDTRGNRPQRRLFCVAQALSECRLLLGHHLQRLGNSPFDVHSVIRHCAHRRLGRALAGNGLRSPHENRPTAPALRGTPTARLPTDSRALSVNTDVAALVGLRRRRLPVVDASDVSGKDARAEAGRLEERRYHEGCKVRKGRWV